MTEDDAAAGKVWSSNDTEAYLKFADAFVPFRKELLHSIVPLSATDNNFAFDI
jgi:hypothetical protein